MLSGKMISQTDTLHLYYVQVKTTLEDSAAAKIDKWVKKLNGQHVDIDVVAYYSKPEFKKYAQQRCDDLFLILNRKARAVITIKSIAPKSGKNSQRSTVDVIYRATLSPEAAAAAAAKEKEEAAKKKEAEKLASKEKSEKEKSDKDGSKDVKTKSKTDVVKEEQEKDKGKKKEGKDSDEGKGKKGDDDDKGKKDGKGDGDDQDYGQASSRQYNDGYAISDDEVQFIKRAKLVVAQTGRKDVDQNLLFAVKEFWDFSKNPVALPYDEVRKSNKENKKDSIAIISFIQVKTWFEKKTGPVTIKMPYFGYAVCIETGRGHTLLKQFINKVSGQPPSLAALAAAVSYMNDICKIMDENKLPKSSKVDPIYDSRVPELKQRTLYISEKQIHPKLPIEDISQYYTSPYKIVTQEELENAILEKKDVAYAYVVLTPNPQHTCFHYLIDAKTGRVYIFDYGAAVSFVPSGVIEGTNSGVIDKPNFVRYEKRIKEAIEDNDKRAADKVKKAEKDKAKAAKKEEEEEAKKAKEKEKSEAKVKSEDKKEGENKEEKEEKKKEGKKGKKGESKEETKSEEKKSE
jgi:hypothetical protein